MSRPDTIQSVNNIKTIESDDVKCLKEKKIETNGTMSRMRNKSQT